MKMEPNHKTLPILAMTLGVCLILLSSTKVIAAVGFCNRPESEALSSVKANLVAEINSTVIVKRGEEREMKPADVKILQAYEKEGFILVSYQYSCCFEGLVILFRKSNKGLKKIGYFNGYDSKGIFIGFERKLVVRNLSRLVPPHVKGMIDCYDQAQQGGGTQSAQ